MRPTFSLLLHHPGWMGVLAGVFGVLALRLPMFVIPAAALVALPILREGPWHGGVALLTGSAVVAAGWAGLGLPPGQWLPLVFVLWPVIVPMAVVLRRTGKLGSALLVAAAAMLAGVLAMHWSTGDVVDFWQNWLQRTLAAIPGGSERMGAEAGSLRLMNGFLALLLGLSLFLALLLARWLQFRSNGRAGFSAEFRQLQLPLWVLPLTVALIWAGGLRDPALLSDLLMIGILLYFFLGLAVLHGVFQARGWRPAWLIPVYLFVLLLPPEGMATLALVGAVDVFVRFRDQQGNA